MKSSAFLFIIFLLTVHSCGPKLVKKSSDLTDTLLTSPNGDITIDFSLDEIGSPTYSIWAFDQEVIKPSTLGLHTTKWQELTSGFEILSSETRMQSETWDLPWGEQDRVVNRYSELAVYLRHKQDNVALTLLFRAYDDGVAFRYLIPRQQNIMQLHILDKSTFFIHDL